jgi:hypothetical protein
VVPAGAGWLDGTAGAAVGAGADETTEVMSSFGSAMTAIMLPTDA